MGKLRTRKKKKKERKHTAEQQEEGLTEMLDQFGKYTVDVDDFTNWVMDGAEDEQIEKVVKNNYEAVVIVDEAKLRSSKPDPGQELCDCAGHGHMDHMRELLSAG